MGYRNSSGTCGLPTKFAVPTAEQHRIARDLGALFDRIGLPRYAGLCTGPVTESVLDAYHTGGRTTGITAYRKALHGGGVEPPDIPGVVTWDGVLGVEEHTAFWALADPLEKPSPPHTPQGAAGGGSPRPGSPATTSPSPNCTSAGTRTLTGSTPNAAPGGPTPAARKGSRSPRLSRRCSPRRHRCPVTPRTTSRRSAGSCRRSPATAPP